MIFFSKKIPNTKFHIKRMKNKHVQQCEVLDRQIFLSNSSRTDFSKELKKTNTEYFIISMEDRNCGLGEFLMIGAIDSAINRNAELVTLEVRISNYSAKKLYSKFGFNEVGIRKNYYFDNREDALIMTTNSILNSNYQEEFYKIYQTQLKIYKESS